MAIRALDLGRVRHYVSKLDDGSEGAQTVFQLGTITGRDRGRIRDSVTSFTMQTGDAAKAADGGGEMTTSIAKSRMNYEAVRLGLKGWENFLDAKGNAVPFETHERDVGGQKRTVVKDSLLDMLPIEIVDELADEIMEANTVTEDDAGN